MFIVRKFSNITYHYNSSNELKKIIWNNQKLTAILRKKYSSVITSGEDLYFNHIQLQKCKKIKKVKIIDSIRNKIHVIPNEIVKKVGIKKILTIMFWFQIDVVSTIADNKNIGIWFGELPKLPIKHIKSVQGIWKMWFLYTTIRSWGSYSTSCRFSYWLWQQWPHYIDNVSHGVHVIRSVSRKIALSEAIERISGGTVPKMKMNNYSSSETEKIMKNLCGTRKLDTKAEHIQLISLQNTGEKVYVPAELVFYPYPSTTWYSSSSSWMSCHTSISKSLLTALLELIERDAFILCRLLKTGVTKQAPPAQLRRRVQQLYTNWFTVSFFSINFDNPVPVILCVSVDKMKRSIIWLWCHYDPTIAFGKALSEIENWIPLFSSLIKKPDEWSVELHTYTYLKKENYKQVAWLLRLEENPYPLKDVAKKQNRVAKYHLNKILKHYGMLWVQFYYYLRTTTLNTIYHRFTTRVISDWLIPVYFSSTIPSYVFQNERLCKFKKIYKRKTINNHIHPLG